jgi:hypothetical protein
MSTAPKSAIAPDDVDLVLPQGATDMRLLLLAGLATLLLASALLFYARMNAEKAR